MICTACTTAADAGDGRHHPCIDLISCTCQHGGKVMMAGVPITVDPTVSQGTMLIVPDGHKPQVWEAV